MCIRDSGDVLRGGPAAGSLEEGDGLRLCGSAASLLGAGFQPAGDYTTIIAESAIEHHLSLG